MTIHRLALAACLVIATAPAAADICRYIDEAGAGHYSNLPPEKGWRRESCTNGDPSPDRWKAWLAARQRIKIGMTETQMRAIDPLMRSGLRSRRVVESAQGRAEWLDYPEFQILLRNGRVSSISY